MFDNYYAGDYYAGEEIKPQFGMIQRPYFRQIYPQQMPAAGFSDNRLAYAIIEAGPDYPSVSGFVTFTAVPGGVRVCANITGLPSYKPAAEGKQPVGPFGFHIHEKGNCGVGDPAKPFEGCGGHWNPTGQPHGNHAGDFPVLFSNSGRANMCFFTDRFNIDDIIGRSVIIHESPDDYRTQPAGNSGKRIAYGTIRLWNPFGYMS